MLPNIYALMKANPAVVALLGPEPRVYQHGRAPQNVEAPYVTWGMAGGAAENGLDGACADQFRLQFDCWSNTDTGAQGVNNLASVIRAAVEPSAHLVAYVADGRDPETQRYRIAFSFDWWDSR